MEIKGKIIVALPEVSGTSKAGNAWKKREYVLETQETYPKRVFFNFFGERVDQYPLNIGDVITLSFDIDSREFNGRWYTDIRGWKAEKEGATESAAPVAENFSGAVPPPPMAIGGADESDDLPF